MYIWYCPVYTFKGRRTCKTCMKRPKLKKMKCFYWNPSTVGHNSGSYLVEQVKTTPGSDFINMDVLYHAGNLEKQTNGFKCNLKFWFHLCSYLPLPSNISQNLMFQFWHHFHFVGHKQMKLGQTAHLTDLSAPTTLWCPSHDSNPSYQ